MKSSLKTFALLFLSFMVSAPLLFAQWTVETVDATGDVGKSSSMGVDSNGHSHICYYDDTNNKVNYATNKTGVWVTEAVDDIPYTLGQCSLALDSYDGVHICYSYAGTHSLKYATNKSGVWVTEGLSKSFDVGYNNSITVDQFGHVHIAYILWKSASKDYVLRYTTNKSGLWAHETVDNSDFTGFDNSIVVDNLENVHISYVDWDSEDMMYAKRPAGGGWTLEAVEYGGEFTSIAVDSSGFPHIAYCNYKSVKHAVYTGLSWNLETVHDNNFSVEYTSIAIDSMDKIHIAFLNRLNYDLIYASNCANSFAIETVESIGSVGVYASIDIGPSDSVHIAYYHKSDKELHYAFHQAPLSLNTVPSEISWTTGGTVNFYLNARISNRLRHYIILGSLSGISPGIPLPGGLATLPVAYDLFTNIMMDKLNGPIFSNFLGGLSGGGQSIAQLSIPSIPGATGLKFYFAFALNSPWDFASNPVTVTIVP